MIYKVQKNIEKNNIVIQLHTEAQLFYFKLWQLLRDSATETRLYYDLSVFKIELGL